MKSAPFKPLVDASIQEKGSPKVTRAFIGYWYGTPIQGTAAAVLAAVTDNSSAQTFQAADLLESVPDYARVVTATAGGTGGDIGAVSVVVNGTDLNDEVISETLPAFTVDTAGIVTGTKAFKTITSLVIPAHDGNGATTAIGWGDKLGISGKFRTDPVIHAAYNRAVESTAPTVTVHPATISLNTIEFDTQIEEDSTEYWYVINPTYPD